MTPEEKEHIALMCVAAACADGHMGREERVRIERLVEKLGFADRDMFQEAMRHPLDFGSVAEALPSAEGRRTAYLAAAIVCRADGVLSGPEQLFLGRVQQALKLSDATASGLRIEAQQYADPGLPPTAPSRAGGTESAERQILRYAILAGAAELLPQSAAAAVVLPLQIKLVYEVGRRHDVALDRAQILELAAVFGLGATSQVVESLARRVLGGVARTVGGKGLGRVLGGATEAAAGVLVSFSTTYALGHSAEAYYAKGRTLGKEDLQALFNRFQGEARTLYPKVEEEIRLEAEKLDVKSLLARVRAIA